MAGNNRLPTGKTVLGTLSSKPPSPPAPHHRKPPSFLYAMLDPNSDQYQAVLFKRIISAVIVIDLISFILETENTLADYKYVFHWMEIFSSCLFLLEYLIRLLTCVEKPRFRHQGAILGRLCFIMTGSALIDALSMLPWFLEPLVGFDLPRLTYLRFLRLLRITKTHWAMRGTDAVYRVVYYNREILIVATFVCAMLVMGTGVALYYLRPPDDHLLHEAPDEQFQSILSTMYLSTMLLTGQGGPEGDLPWYTKAIVTLTSVVSVAMFAIPSSMLTWGFEAEAQRMAKRRYTLNQRRRESGSEELSDDDYSTDEEYQKIIAGEEADDDDDDDESQDPWQKELLEQFRKADGDGSGNLTLREFMELSAKQATSGTGGPILAGMMCRVQQLERDVKANSTKLDKILELLESKKDK